MRRRFTREFKLTVLHELETASLTEVCRKHSVDVSTVSNWRKDFEKNPQKAVAESFFKTLKVEEVYLKEYKTFEDAYHNIQRFIEDVYNAKRLHSPIGYKTPNEMEAEVLNIS